MFSDRIFPIFNSLLSIARRLGRPAVAPGRGLVLANTSFRVAAPLVLAVSVVLALLPRAASGQPLPAAAAISSAAIAPSIVWICDNDGLCDRPFETADNCVDCIDGIYCGDGYCEGPETTSSCPADCPPVCGDGVCEGNETRSSCPADCVPPPGTPTNVRLPSSDDGFGNYPAMERTVRNGQLLFDL